MTTDLDRSAKRKRTAPKPRPLPRYVLRLMGWDQVAEAIGTTALKLRRDVEMGRFPAPANPKDRNGVPFGDRKWSTETVIDWFVSRRPNPPLGYAEEVRDYLLAVIEGEIDEEG